MYFTADAGDGFHLWRQAYPDGVPEQLTSAITQEEGLAIAPDGRSLITSVGLRRRANFVRSTSGEERQIPTEGYAFWPLFSADGQKLCYRVTRGAATGQAPAELWMMDVATGRSERLLPGQLVTAYDLSRDDRVVAAVREADGSGRIWLAWLDGREPARPIPNLIGDNPRFLDRDHITFRGQEGSTMFLFRAATDGTGLQRLAHSEGVTSVISSTSPDGRWLTAIGSLATTPRSVSFLMLYSATGSEAVPVLPHTAARIRWSADGRRMYVSIQAGEASGFAVGRTYAFPLEAGSVLPRIPKGGFRSVAELAKVSGVQVFSHGDFAAGPSPEIYAFSRETVTRNLYRIPLP